jgi:two-component system chemotaxis response regulator CheY
MGASNDIKILIVDDMGSMRQYIKIMLANVGFNNVFEANDGSTALPMLVQAKKENKPFDLILSDWNMPIMTGIDLLRIVRKTKELQQTVFLMITMEAEHTNVQVAIAEGVSSFIIKPFTEQTLSDKINSLFN